MGKHLPKGPPNFLQVATRTTKPRPTHGTGIQVEKVSSFQSVLDSLNHDRYALSNANAHGG